MGILKQMVEALGNIAKALNRIADEIANLPDSQTISQHGGDVERGLADVAKAIDSLDLSQ